MATPSRDFVHVPPPHPASITVDALLVQCDWGRERGSGPGGQHRNKVETGVWLTHKPTGIESHAGERRSAEENKKVAISRLRHSLAIAVRCPVTIGEIRSKLWLSRCPEDGGGRISCSPEHADYPALLAEALDVICDSGMDVKRASLRLSCSMSQLVKFIKDHPPAMVRLNDERSARNLHPLK